MTATATPAHDDSEARTRILADLDTNLMVEAGAGSGKTTSMVGRMLAYVRRGTPVDQLAAVTFTRKAATELRERLEVKLEEAVREAWAGGDREAIERLARAREELDRAFVGTIHSFCGRLLREHPLEAGLDPSFEEISEEEWPELRRLFWSRWLEHCRRTGDPALARLRNLGLDPRGLLGGFESVVRFPDVEFPAPECPPPDHAPCRRRLEALLRDAGRLMPAREPEGGWDPLQSTVRRLRFLMGAGGWDRIASFCDGVAFMTASGCRVTQIRWADTKEGKQAAKDLSAAFTELVDGDLAALLTAWREHRYAPVMSFLGRAAEEFRRERLATGRLGFEDLLLGAAALLRTHAGARRALGQRYRHLLVDEFQDTDPIQAEVCFLLASDPESGTDWRRVTPRPGALFVVGDPKQSIYRFRRADIQTYEMVKERIRRSGEVLYFSRNFRSVDAVATLVNGHFRGPFPDAASDVQAAFTPLVTVRPGEVPDGVCHYRVEPARRAKEEIVATCAAQVASWIASRIERDRCAPGDFLVLGFQKWVLAAYAKALAERNVPVAVTGAGLPQEYELRELIVVLRALADPANPVLVAAALEGLFVGCSPADLFAARETRLDFSITHAPEESTSCAGRGLAQLHAWWLASQRSPADLVLDRILDDTGLLAYATSQPLGENRAGALLHLVESLRVSTVRAGGTLAAAIDTIERVLAEASSDAPLRPGRGDAVRVMNLHKAKGLEARVVILAAPIAIKEHPIASHVRRDVAGSATGGLAVVGGDDMVLAQPPGWADMESEERRFLAAERDRLLYVAATRAMRELVVARLWFVQAKGPAEDKSMWSPLAPALEGCGTAITLPIAEPPGRHRLESTVDDIRQRTFEAEGRRIRASGPSFRMETVTESAKAERETERSYDLRPAGGRGAAWGRAVHRALEAVGRGRSGAALEAYIRAIVLDERLPEHGGDVDELVSELATLVERVRDTEAWRTFAGAEQTAFELPIVRVTRDGDATIVTEGVIDAAARIGGEWRIFDWKTDDVSDEAWAERLRAYERQVGAYAEMLGELGGDPAHGEIVRVP